MPSDRLKQAPLLAVFAHPDDEFAVFPWLRRAIAEGRTVEAVWLTDGGWGGQDTVRRRAESIAVLSGLGLDPASMHFCGEEWGGPTGSFICVCTKWCRACSSVWVGPALAAKS